MPEPNSLETRLTTVFLQKHIKAMLEHFTVAIESFQEENWEICIARGGKFIEATLKSLHLYTGGTLPPARQFKVNTIIRNLMQLPTGTFNDTIRITIPRACEFVYDIASNRGARHDPDEVNPNEMDATIMVATISWIVSELLRYSQKGVADQTPVKDLIQGIIQRRFPFIEDVDGRTYFHIPNISGRKIAILALWHQHPKRMSRNDLISILIRHRVSKANAITSLTRIADVVDIDENEKYRLLKPGLIEAEQLIKVFKQ